MSVGDLIPLGLGIALLLLALHLAIPTSPQRQSNGKPDDFSIKDFIARQNARAQNGQEAADRAARRRAAAYGAETNGGRTVVSERTVEERRDDAHQALSAARGALMQAARAIDGISPGVHRTLMVAITTVDDAQAGVRRERRAVVR